MLDILLDENGDLDIDEIGDISPTDSIAQSIMIKLRWVENEWKLDPDAGLPVFSEIFLKNPELSLVQQIIRDEILSVDDVEDADVMITDFDQEHRSLTVYFTAQGDGEEITEEVVLGG